MNVSFLICEIGVAEPPTIAQMEKELKTIPNEINLMKSSLVDFYIDKTPEKKSSWNFHYIIGICIVIFTIAGITIACICCRSKKDEFNENIMRINSNTSNISNIS